MLSRSPNGEPFQRGVLILLGWLMIAGLIGFLVSPAITWTLASWSSTTLPIVGELRPADYVARKGHVSVFGRTVMVVALVGLVLLRRPIGIGWGRLDRLGVVCDGFCWRSAATDFAVGFGVAALGLAAAVVFKLVVGEAVWELDPNFMRRLTTALAAAVVVSVIEEPLFRGLIQSGLVGRLGPALGILVTNLIFSASHCLSAAKPGRDGTAVVLVEGPIDLAASGQCLLAFVHSWSNDPAGTAIKFVSLLLFGLMLSWSVRARSGLVYLAMGLHAGTVFVLQGDGAITSPNQQFNLVGWRLVLGGKHMESALIAWAVMLMVTALTWVWIQHSGAQTSTTRPACSGGLDSDHSNTV